jgi:hypothetical protein
MRSFLTMGVSAVALRFPRSTKRASTSSAIADDAFAEAMARLDTMPTGFLDWMGTMPPLPEDAVEVVGPRKVNPAE